jgi:hypothetical protein
MPPARRSGNSRKATKWTPALGAVLSCPQFEITFPMAGFEAFFGVQENMPVGLVSVESLGNCASQQY